MSLNTSFAGNIPWLITEPPTVALARGMQAGEGIARQRLQQQQIGLQAAQQTEQAAQARALEAHRKVVEGIEQAQEARLKAAADRIASQELSRQIGMAAASQEIDAFEKANPKATDEDRRKVRFQALSRNAPQIFSGNPTQFLNLFDDEEKNRIAEQGKILLYQQKMVSEERLRDKDRLIDELGRRKILSAEEIAAAKDATARLGLEGKRVMQDSVANLNEAKANAIETGGVNADLTNIIARPVKDPETGAVISFAMPNGKGGIHYVTAPQGKTDVVFGKTPTGQSYMAFGGRFQLLKDPEQEAKMKIAAKGLEDVNQRIRDIESSSRLKPEEREKRLKPLLKQQGELEKSLEGPKLEPAAIPSSTPSKAALLNAPASTATSAPPLPVDRSQWTKGQSYLTDKGVLLWDGERFIKP